MPPPEKLLTELTKIGGRQPRTHALWVDERDTPRRYRRQARSLDRRGTGTPRRHVRVRALEKAGRSLRRVLTSRPAIPTGSRSAPPTVKAQASARRCSITLRREVIASENRA